MVVFEYLKSVSSGLLATYKPVSWGEKAAIATAVTVAICTKSLRSMVGCGVLYGIYKYCQVGQSQLKAERVQLQPQPSSPSTNGSAPVVRNDTPKPVVSDLPQPENHPTQPSSPSTNSSVPFTQQAVSNSAHSVNQPRAELIINMPFEGAASAPDLKQYTRLQKVNFEGNCFSDAPDFTGNPELVEINLKGNPGLNNTPNLTRNLKLNVLDISFCSLDEAPNMSNHSELVTINLRNNFLKDVPKLPTHAPNLRSVDLSDNSIRSLPETLAALPRQCMIKLSGNQISLEELGKLKDQIARIRDTSPNLGPEIEFIAPIAQTQPILMLDNPLKAELEKWMKEFSELGVLYNFSMLDKLSSEQIVGKDRSVVDAFLQRIRHTKDYAESKKTVAQSLANILNLACQNEEFRNQMIVDMFDGLADCHNRIQSYLNDIKIKAQIYSVKNKSELAIILIGNERNERIKQFSSIFCKLDPIEAFLYFQFKLKDPLRLPVETTGQSEERMATHQDADKLIQKAFEFSKETTGYLKQQHICLSKNPYWQAYLQKRMPTEYDKIVDSFSNQVDLLPKNLTQIESLKQQRIIQQNMQIAVERWALAKAEEAFEEEI